MHKLYELKEKLMRELEDYSENGKFSKEDVEAIKYITSAIDHICNIVERDDGDDMSSYRNYEGGMSGRRSRRNDGGSSRRDGGSSYARGRGRRRDSMGRYSSYEGSSSYEDGSEEMVMELRELMQSAPNEQIRKKVERFISEIENM